MERIRRGAQCVSKLMLNAVLWVLLGFICEDIFEIVLEDVLEIVLEVVLEVVLEIVLDVLARLVQKEIG